MYGTRPFAHLAISQPNQVQPFHNRSTRHIPVGNVPRHQWCPSRGPGTFPSRSQGQTTWSAFLGQIVPSQKNAPSNATGMQVDLHARVWREHAREQPTLKVFWVSGRSCLCPRHAHIHRQPRHLAKGRPNHFYCSTPHNKGPRDVSHATVHTLRTVSHQSPGAALLVPFVDLFRVDRGQSRYKLMAKRSAFQAEDGSSNLPTCTQILGAPCRHVCPQFFRFDRHDSCTLHKAREVRSAPCTRIS